MRFAIVFSLALVLASAGCGSSDEQGSPDPGRFDGQAAFEDLEAQVDIGPRPSGSPENKELVDFLAERLEDAGAENVSIQRPWRNVVATIPGSEPGTVVIGAHHDTKDIPGFLGANDGASGVAVVLELARVLGREKPLDGPSVSVALFDAEEARGERAFEVDGTRGSEQYVDLASDASQGSPELGGIRSMILFDMVGDCDLQIPMEAGSDPGLYSQFEAAAQEATGSAAPFEGTTGGILDDHVPFIEAGIPSLDLIDFTFGDDSSPGPYWHTVEDTADKVCPESLDAVGEAAVRVLAGAG